MYTVSEKLYVECVSNLNIDYFTGRGKSTEILLKGCYKIEHKCFFGNISTTKEVVVPH